ncbi:MAG: 30S ribosomal protein S5 [Nanoarchaeota archaeon]
MEQKTQAIEWQPKTALGRKVKNKEIVNIDEILDAGRAILEEQITDNLLSLDSELLLIGQSKGKFGGGQRRVFRQTQKKTQEGNKPKFSTMAVVGDRNGHIGIGFGKSKDTVPAREKALRQGKLNIMKIRRGCGSWQCNCGTSHSIPFSVTGKCGSVILKLMPAPKGKGLCIETECAKILSLAGIQDIWSKSQGQTKNRINMITALEKALLKLSQIKIQPDHLKMLSIVEGSQIQEKQTGEAAAAAEPARGRDTRSPRHQERKGGQKRNRKRQ